MSKKKILVGLLCAAMIGPMTACEEVNSTSNNGSNGGVNTSSSSDGNIDTTQEKLNKAAAATKAKLIEELNKEVGALKLNFEYNTEMIFDYYEETYTVVGTVDDYDLELTNSTLTEEGAKESVSASIEMIANLDYKYYTDLLTAEDPTTLSNGTELYLGVDMAENDVSNKLEAMVSNNTATTKVGESTDSSAIDLETNMQIATIFSELKKVSTYSEEETLNYIKEILSMVIGGQSGETYPEGDTGEVPPVVGGENSASTAASSLLDSVIGFINGTVTSAELVELILPFISNGEEVDPSMKTFLISVLDYIKTIDASSLITLSASQEGEQTLFTLTFDYEAFKTLVAKVFDDIKSLMLDVAPEESAENIAIGMDQTKAMILEELPTTVEFSETIGVTNGLITSSHTDILLEGENLPYSSVQNSSLPIDPETGDILIGGTTTLNNEILTKQEVSFGFNFEFGTEPFDVPTLTVA